MSEKRLMVSAEGLHLGVSADVAMSAKRFSGPDDAGSAPETQAHTGEFTYAPATEADAELWNAFPPELGEARYELVYRPAAPGGRPHVELQASKVKWAPAGAEAHVLKVRWAPAETAAHVIKVTLAHAEVETRAVTVGGAWGEAEAQALRVAWPPNAAEHTLALLYRPADGSEGPEVELHAIKYSDRRLKRHVRPLGR